MAHSSPASTRTTTGTPLPTRTQASPTRPGPPRARTAGKRTAAGTVTRVRPARATTETATATAATPGVANRPQHLQDPISAGGSAPIRGQTSSVNESQASLDGGAARFLLLSARAPTAQVR